MRAPKGGLLPQSCGAPSGRRGPGERPRQARGCRHRHAGGRQGGREPWGFGAPSVSPLVQDGGGRGQGGGEVALMWSQTQTLLWGKSTGQPLPGSPAGHAPISRGPRPSHGTPVGCPLGRPADVRAAALSTLLLALEVSPSWTGFMDGNLTSPPPPAPELLWATALTGTPGLSECPNTPPAPAVYHPCLLPAGQGRPQPRLRPASRLMGSFPGPTHTPVGSLGTGGVGDRPSACPLAGEYQNKGVPIRLTGT